MTRTTPGYQVEVEQTASGRWCYVMTAHGRQIEVGGGFGARADALAEGEYQRARRMRATELNMGRQAAAAAGELLQVLTDGLAVDRQAVAEIAGDLVAELQVLIEQARR